MKGQHPKLVSDILGHRSVAITLDMHSHVIPGMSDMWTYSTATADVLLTNAH